MHGNNGVYTYANGTVYKGSFYHNTMTGECSIDFGKDFEI